MEDVIDLIRRHRFVFVDEDELQRMLAKLFDDHGVEYRREMSLGTRGRIDFFLPNGNIGIEVKVKGSPSAVARQMSRYAEHDNVKRLVLVTSRMLSGKYLNHRLNGKQVDVVPLWEGGL